MCYGFSSSAETIKPYNLTLSQSQMQTYVSTGDFADFLTLHMPQKKWGGPMILRHNIVVKVQ